MKIRTVYFKVPQMDVAISFWGKFLETVPHKKSKEWTEYRCQDINFALLRMPGFTLPEDAANCVPVFELADDQLEATKERALLLGATVVVEIANHPDRKSYVLADPQGNEFEITKTHDPV